MMSRSFNSGSRPKLACEIAADRVLAGRLSENGHTVEVCATEELASGSVVEDYEAIFREAGYNPGVVMPSMLAALGAADAGRPTLVIKVDARTTSIAILDQQIGRASCRERV